jgi:hypothetical protein
VLIVELAVQLEDFNARDFRAGRTAWTVPSNPGREERDREDGLSGFPLALPPTVTLWAAGQLGGTIDRHRRQTAQSGVVALPLPIGK